MVDMVVYGYGRADQLLESCRPVCVVFHVSTRWLFAAQFTKKLSCPDHLQGYLSVGHHQKVRIGDNPLITKASCS